MSRISISSIQILMVSMLLICTSCDSTKKLVSKDSERTIHLFNGNNLDGWYTYMKDLGRDKDPKKVFSVEDGVLHISGEMMGCIITEKEYENYHLIAEYKWGDKTYGSRVEQARDNGIFVHCTGEDGVIYDSWMRSFECQIIEGGTGDILILGDKTDRWSMTSPVADEKQRGSYVYSPDGKMVTNHSGRINWWGRSPDWEQVLGFRGERDIENPVGEWNKMEIIASGDTLTLKLNGVVVNQGFEVRPAKGRILIQSHLAEIFFRKVDLIQL